MAHSSKAVAVSLVGAGLLGALVLQGSAHAGEAEPAKQPKKKPPKPTAKVTRVTLALKFAKVFGVPASLVLAAISVGRMSLKTAKDIWPKAGSKIGKSWDGTAAGLADPAISVGLSAYYLSLWWKRYKLNRLRWILSGYAYILGPGRVRKVLPNDTGTLPKPLPADFARVRGSFAKAIATPIVKKALAQEKTQAQLSGDPPLVGKKLAATIPDTTTGYQARAMFGEMTKTVKNAYATLANYDPSGIAQATRLDAGSIAQAKKYLDGINSMLGKWYPLYPESHNKLTPDQLKKLKAAVSTTSVAVKTVDDMFSTSWGSELFSSIKQAAQGIIHTAADVVGLDKTSAAIAIAGVVGVGFLVLAIKK